MTGQYQQQRIWDVPIRLFHWLLVATLGFSWWSAETHHMDWHQYSGITVCGLMVFRFVWGFVGSSTARFASFVKGPWTVWSYVHSADVPSHQITSGHNPLGGWSVILLLLLITVQFVSGMFAVDIDGLESGPLSYLLDFDQGRSASSLHKASFNLLLLCAAIHIAAIVFYLVAKRRNLILPMVTGVQVAAQDSHPTMPIMFVSHWRAVVAALVSGLLTYYVVSGFRF